MARIIDIVRARKEQLKGNPVLAGQNAAMAIAALHEGIKSNAWQFYMSQFVDRSTGALDKEQLARLTPTERRILRLKALVGVATNKNDFLTLLNGSGVTAPGGGSWSYNLINPILNRLLTLGLLKPDFSCVESLRHALAIEMVAAPEGPKAAEAVRRMFPAVVDRPFYYSYSPQSDPGAGVRLR